MAITRIGNPALADVREPNFRNIIINGGMDLAQRGTSTSGITGSGVFVVDRWKMDEVADSTLTMSQETLTSGDAYNNGFKKSLKVLVTTADTSIGTTQSVQLIQPVEAQNLQYLNFGTANAKDLTLSFWYKSNVTGVHTVCIDKIDSTRATCPLEFTVSSADTWTKYTLNANANAVVQGSTATIANDNGTGFRVMWGLAYGSAYQSGTNGTWVQNGTASFSTSNQQNILASASNYVEITGVQLEAGSVASDFEFLPVDVNLGRCQRYCYVITGATDQNIAIGDNANGSGAALFFLPLLTTMRSAPSGTFTTASHFEKLKYETGWADLSSIALSSTQPFLYVIEGGSSQSDTRGVGTALRINNSSGKITLSSEL